MNVWNGVHRTIRRATSCVLIFLALVVVLGVVLRDALPDDLERFANKVLFAAALCAPVVAGLYVYASRRKDPAPRGRTDAVCGFCGRGCRQLEVLIAGPEASICAQCVLEGYALLSAGGDAGPDGRVRCSFCQRERPVTEVLVREPARICRVCVETCRASLVEEDSMRSVS